DKEARQGIHLAGKAAAGVGTNNHVAHLPKRAARREWLFRENIEARTTQVPARERLCERRVIEQAGSREVIEEAARWHGGEFSSAYQRPVALDVRETDNGVLRACKRVLQPFERKCGVGEIRRHGATLHRKDRRAQRGDHTAECRADSSQTQDRDSAALNKLIGGGTSPNASLLVLDVIRKLTSKGKHH